ncbi:MAG: hypothetical protein U0234_18945 [Sandaracinus sp.]
MKPPALILAAAAVLLSTSCTRRASAFDLAARARARVALRCPDESLTIAEIGGGGMDALGCGLHQTYTCVAAGRQGVVCAPDGAPTGHYEPPPPTPTGDGGPEGVRVLEAAATCALPAYTAVRVGIGVNGDLLALTVDPPGPEGECLEQRLREIRFETRPDLEYVEVSIPPAPSDAAPTEIIPPATPTTTSVDALARARVDGLRDAILACTSGAATAVIAEWAADGALTVRLPDAHAGTPEDGCVRAAASGARLDPAPGTSGSVLHPVH